MHKVKWLIVGIIGAAILLCAWMMWPKARAVQPESQNFPLKLLWTYDLDDNILRPPRLAGSLVIFFTSKPWPFNAFYYGLNTENGDLAWKHETSNELGEWFERSWAATDNVMILSSSSIVEAVGLTSGETTWTSSWFNALIAVASSDNTIFVSSKGSVTALDSVTGLIRWNNDTLPGYSFNVFYDEQTNSVVVPDENIYRLNAADGTTLSVVPVARSFSLACYDWLENIRFYDGLVFCGATAIDAVTGQIVSDKYKDNGGRELPLIQSDVMYLTTGSGTIQAINLNTFNKMWEYAPENDKGRVDILSGVAIVNNAGYAIADDGTLRAFDISNGEETGWWLSPEGVTDWRGVIGGYSAATALAGVVSDGTKLFVSFGGKTLYAFGP